ncbi:hypothetical protein GGR22_003194 [Flavobacterium gossypii]|uniref:Lipoprotein n=1 Tax=Flavobacterium gossypii TaxID=1646119 RepID=A0ABR6DTL2_9FLAO|nr:hypothetical protein [Flavobacterium gossypii]MBA9075017.1 hypothetical protein [Flavobacterium gossypii]
MKTLLKLAVFSLVVTGCASRLKVTVKVADREQILAMAEASLKTEVLPSIIALENFKNSWNEQALLDEIFASVEKKLEAKLRPAIKDDYKKQFQERFGSKIILINGYIDEAKKQYDAGKANDAFMVINKANLEIMSIQGVLKDYKADLAKATNVGGTIEYGTQKAMVQKSINDIGPGPAEKSLAVAAKAAVAGSDRTRFPILGDPLTSYITQMKNGKELIWKNTFNKTVSWNLFGNSDVAVILRSNPPEKEMKTGDYNNNFIVKGVRMDAADATNALITGLTQTMNFIANTQGISVPMPQPTNTTDPVPVQNPLVTGFFADTMTYTTKKKRLEDCKKMLIEKIKMENIGAIEDEDEFNKAVLRIEAYWTSLKAELNK